MLYVTVFNLPSSTEVYTIYDEEQEEEEELSRAAISEQHITYRNGSNCRLYSVIDESAVGSNRARWICARKSRIDVL